MKISELQNGQTVRLRTGRAGRTDVAWGPWRNAPLYVQRDHKGRVCNLTPTDQVWAEYDPRSLGGRGKASTPESYRQAMDSDTPGVLIFITEDWYMETEGITR